MLSKRIKIILFTIVILLLVPFIAMQFTNEVNWSLLDFIIAGTLLLSTGLICEFAIRKIQRLKYRILVCLVILLLFLVVWIEIAVGIFGTSISGS